MQPAKERIIIVVGAKKILSAKKNQLMFEINVLRSI